jgi:hypothetical protein
MLNCLIQFKGRGNVRGPVQLRRAKLFKSLSSIVRSLFGPEAELLPVRASPELLLMCG